MRNHAREELQFLKELEKEGLEGTERWEDTRRNFEHLQREYMKSLRKDHIKRWGTNKWVDVSDEMPDLEAAYVELGGWTVLLTRGDPHEYKFYLQDEEAVLRSKGEASFGQEELPVRRLGTRILRAHWDALNIAWEEEEYGGPIPDMEPQEGADDYWPDDEYPEYYPL